MGKREILLIFIILGALGLLGRMLIGGRRSEAPPPPPPDLARVHEEDRVRLEAGAAPDAELIKTIKRYSDQGGPEVTEALRKYLAHTSLPIRAAAIEAAGTIDGDPFRDEIELAFSSTSPELRMAAMRAMTRSPKGDTRARLCQYRRRKGLAQKEWFVSLSACFRLTPDDSEKSEIAGIFAKNPPYDPAVRSETFIDIFKLLQKDPNAILMAQGEVRKPATQESAMAAFTYLENNDRDWLFENLHHVTVSDSRVLQLRIVEYLKNFCAREWQAVLDSLLAKKRQPDVLKQLSDAEISRRCAGR